jgi:hypothetical protein
MKIEVGKSYRDEKGRKHGPVRASDWDRFAFIADMDGRNEAYYHEDGTCPWLDDRNLVAEWTDDGLTRTVTRLEVVPGVYDRVHVVTPDDGMVNLHVMFALHDPSADELDAAAAVLTDIAKAVRGNV